MPNLLQSAFDAVDTDKSGDISAAEYAAATGRSSLDAQLAKVDLDNSGTISVVEFLFAIFRTKGESFLMECTLNQFLKNTKLTLLISAFKQYDQNNSGFISVSELSSFFEAHGGAVDDVDALVKGADFNGDGKIDYNEFVAMVVKKEL